MEVRKYKATYNECYKYLSVSLLSKEESSAEQYEVIVKAGGEVGERECSCKVG